MQDEDFDLGWDSDSGVDHNLSSMSANASDGASESDSMEMPTDSNYQEFFSDSLYSSSGSCEGLDDDDEDEDDEDYDNGDGDVNADVPRVSNFIFFLNFCFLLVYVVLNGN